MLILTVIAIQETTFLERLNSRVIGWGVMDSVSLVPFINLVSVQEQEEKQAGR